MKKRVINYLLLIFTITSFVIRLIPWKNSIVQWGRWVVFVQPDAYYHLRRATIWAENFPKMPTIDYYMSYPFGAECPWPPLYDWLIAVISLILGFGKVNTQIIQLVTAIIPPILAAVCVYATYKVVFVIWKNERVALISAFFAIIMPGMLGYSTIASGDHHIAETLIGLIFYYYAILVLEDCKKANRISKNSYIQGVLIAIGLLVWQGQVVFYSIWAFYLFIMIIYKKRDESFIITVAKNNLVAAAIGSAIVAIIRFIIPRGTELSLFDFGYFSYFQPLYIFSLYLIIYVTSLMVTFYNKNKILFVKYAGIFIALTVLGFFVLKPLREGLWMGINFLFKTDPWHSSINEFQSTFTLQSLKNINSLPGIINLLYFLSFMLAPIYGMAYLVKIIRKRTNSAILGPLELKIKKINSVYFTKKEFFNINYKHLYKQTDELNLVKSLVFSIVGISFFLLALYQKRWTNSYNPILGIGIALFLNTLYVKIRKGHSFFREFLHWRTHTKKIKTGLLSRLIFYWEKFPLLLTSIILIVVLFPYYYIVSDMVVREGYPIESDTYNTLQWMKRYTPKTSHLLNPTQPPEYGVLSQWDMGHFIQYIAERPTIVNNFGHQLPGGGFETSFYIWSVETEEELYSILDKYKVRYLILTDPVVYMNNDTKAYFKSGFIDKTIEWVPAHFGLEMPYPTDEFFRYSLPNTWIFDGSSNGFKSATRRLRLVFESQNPSIFQYFEDRETKKIKIFEYVKGCVISGKAKPRELIYIRAEFITNFDRRFEWEAAAIADENGNFRGYLPYATSEDNLFIKPLSSYQIFTKDRMLRVFTTNKDVEEGTEIEVDMNKGEDVPGALKEEVKAKLSALAGAVKSRGFMNIHRRINER